METHARYTVVGAFTVAALLAVFLFAYWLNTAGGLGRRTIYRIAFDYSVSGLLVGSSVVFNGMRAGEVVSIAVDPAQPRGVQVEVAVDPEIPVRVDTKAGIEFQGMMSAPVVSLTGGSSQHALEGERPLLTADPAMGQSMTTSAREAFQAITRLVDDNRGEIRTSISNIANFTDALSRNSEKVDSILAGLQRMVGGKDRASGKLFDVTAATSFPSFDRQPKYTLAIKDPVTPFALAQDRILVRTGTALEELKDGGQWVDMMPTLVQLRLVESFENAKAMSQVSKAAEGAESDFQLLTEIRRFEIIADGVPRAEVSYMAKLMNKRGELIAAKEFSRSAELEEVSPKAAASELNTCFQQTAGELVVWVAEAVRRAS